MAFKAGVRFRLPPAPTMLARNHLCCDHVLASTMSLIW